MDSQETRTTDSGTSVTDNQWTLKKQIVPAAESANYRINPFDVTEISPHRDFPLMTVCRPLLNRNLENYCAEVDIGSCDSAQFGPDIGASADKMLKGRLFSYSRPLRCAECFATETATS